MTNPNQPGQPAQQPGATGWAATPQPPHQPLTPTPIPSPNGKPYFRSGGWLEVLSVTAMVLGALMIAFGLIELVLNATPGSGMAAAIGVAIVVLGGILAAILRLGSMLESSIVHRRR